jgi:hypothetical protein
MGGGGSKRGCFGVILGGGSKGLKRGGVKLGQFGVTFGVSLRAIIRHSLKAITSSSCGSVSSALLSSSSQLLDFFPDTIP